MNITEKLDLAIKLKETGNTEGAYAVRYNGEKTQKECYMTNVEWEEFKSSMQANQIQPEAITEYGKGGGDELNEKNGRPPKMASYGSSSRMIYNLSKGKKGFHYEKKLPTTVGGTANLDGFLEEAHRYAFVEAKCHEPYSNKSSSVSSSYKCLYEFINAEMPGSIEIAMKPSKCGRYLEVEYFAEGEKLEHFDLKQMICHLLGIATGLLKGTLKRKQTDFIYLLYDPTELNISDGVKAEIDEIYQRTCYECNLVDFAELFRVILNYLTVNRFNGAMSDDEIEEAVTKFTFALVSQELYPFFIQ